MDEHHQPLGFAAMPVQHGSPEVVFESGPVRFGILALTDEQASSRGRVGPNSRSSPQRSSQFDARSTWLAEHKSLRSRRVKKSLTSAPTQPRLARFNNRTKTPPASAGNRSLNLQIR
jgi:hypothetical protein